MKDDPNTPKTGLATVRVGQWVIWCRGGEEWFPDVGVRLVVAVEVAFFEWLPDECGGW